jgi:hypothetical protein
MKLLIALALLFSTPALAGNGSGNVSSIIGVGSTLAGGPSAYIPLGCPSQTTSPCFTIYSSSGGSVGAADVFPYVKNFVNYQVGAGVKAYCFAGSAQSTTSNGQFQFMYDTSTFASNTATSSLIAPKYQTGAAGNYANIASVGSVGNVVSPLPGMIVFPASSWPRIQVGGAYSFMTSLTCYEAP